MALDTARPILETIGDYDLLEKIAEGGMGAVYKARQRSTDDIVAIKILTEHLAKNEVLVKRFEQEYKSAKTLDHPNIVRALDFGYREGCPFLVMEFVDGETLGNRIERVGRIPESEAIRIITHVAQGLHKAHKLGMIHRDVKPDNILLTAKNQAKLTDLGLVKEIDADLNLTRTGRGLGTPHFMAPEQFRNAKNADARCDIYSLGATLYMMTTGDLPFKLLGPLEAWMKKLKGDLPSARDLNPELSERTDWAIRRAMAAEPDQRPGTCREFVEDLTGHSTKRVTPSDDPKADVWYLRYKDPDGVSHMIKGPTSGIRRNLKEGLIANPISIRASRNKNGPFELLKNHPEFRDLVVSLEQSPIADEKLNPSNKPKRPSSAQIPRKAKAEAPKPQPAKSTPDPAPVPKKPFEVPPEMELTPAPHIHWKDTLSEAEANGTSAEFGKFFFLFLIILVLGMIAFLFYPQIVEFLERLW